MIIDVLKICLVRIINYINSIKDPEIQIIDIRKYIMAILFIHRVLYHKNLINQSVKKQNRNNLSIVRYMPQML